ncbi:type VI protein secretion system component VasK [Luteibacter rhizovicinus]|uniref:Type VI protein secretion system component VasK n=1 Tax=Luteibacter rhizovicinus TaxID=242606 RepID=A0A4R3YVY9_9GAMM|nr:ImcF-related family protein [Luteibacter rhizovicinus]TCV97305.1 type VI protein secretion system component VasK [Luteibacter rhizovicinus]
MKRHKDDDPRRRAMRENVKAWRRQCRERPGIVHLGDPAHIMFRNDIANDADTRIVRTGGHTVLIVAPHLSSPRDAKDAACWHALVDALRRGRRPRAVVFATHARSLRGGGTGERVAMAQRVRCAVGDLVAVMGGGVPLHIVVAGCDMLPGYVEWRSSGDADSMTALPIAWSNGGTRADLAIRLAHIVDNGRRPSIGRLHRMTDVASRARLYAFPRTWMAFASIVAAFAVDGFEGDDGYRFMRRETIHFTESPGRSGSDSLVRVLRVARDERRHRIGLWWRRIAISAAALTAVAVCMFGLSAYRDEQARLDRFTAVIQQVEGDGARSSHPDVIDTRYLDVLRDASIAMTGNESYVFASGHTAALIETIDATYRQTLRDTLLPRIVGRLDAVLRAPATSDPSLLFAALRSYLAMAGSGVPDAKDMESWLRPGLHRHVKHLLKGWGAADRIAPDTQLVRRTRDVLQRTPPVMRIYADLSQQVDRHRLPPVSVARMTNGAAAGWLSMRSNASINDTMPGRFTREGHRLLLARIDSVVATGVANDALVMGSNLSRDQTREDVLDLYGRDYIAAWEHLLRDVRVVAADSADDLARRLHALARDDSALFALMRAASVETTVDDEAGAISRQFAGLRHAMGSVNDAWSNALRTALIDAALEIDAGRQATRAGLAMPASDALTRLPHVLAQGPPVLSSLLDDVLPVARRAARRQAADALAKAWPASLRSFCTLVVAGRYPVDTTSTSESTLVDFERLFAPGGLLDTWFRQHLEAHVDTLAVPWTPRDDDDGTLIAPDDLAAFQHAEQIRRHYFADGTKRAGADFELRAVSMDTRISEFSLVADDGELHFFGEPIRPVTFHWPARRLGGRLMASLLLADGRRIERSIRGDWAWLRWLDEAESAPSAEPNERSLVFDFEGYEVVLALRTASADHPFGARDGERFHCPEFAATRS